MADEQEFEDGRAGGLHPIGKALRATYDADNHDSLGSELTGLMLQLARVDEQAPQITPPPLPTIVPKSSTSWLRRLFGGGGE